MPNLVYNSFVSVLDRDTGQTLPILPGCMQVTQDMIGQTVMNEECVGFVNPASNTTASSQKAAADYQSAKSLRELFSSQVAPAQAPSTLSPALPDFAKLINQAAVSGLQVYGATQGQRPQGQSGAGLKQAPASSGSGVLLVGAVVALGLLGVGIALSKKSSVPAKVAEAPKLVSNKLKKGPGLLAAAGVGLALYGLWSGKQAKLAALAGIEDSVDWLTYEGDGYSNNLVGGGGW